MIALGALAGAFVAQEGTAQTVAAPTAVAPAGVIEGTVYDSLVTRGALRGATVYVVGTTLAATTDSRGRFEMRGVPDGEHTITFAHPALDSAGVLAPQLSVRVSAGGKGRVKVATPSATTLVAASCPGPRSEQTGLLMGTVRDVDTGAPIHGAQVATRWFEASLGRDGARHENMRASVSADAAGVYRLCDIPIDIPLLVRAIADSQQSGRVEVYSRVSPVSFRDFAVSLRDTAARVVADSVLDSFADSAVALAIPRGSARIAGTVRDPNGRPLANVVAALLDRPGVVRSDSAGRFFIVGAPAGSQTIELRAIGFAPVRRVVALRGDAVATVEFMLDRAAQTLAAVRVLGDRARSKVSRSGFDDRRRSAAGWAMDAEEIARTGSVYVGDLLRKAPGMAAQYNRRGERSYTMRGGWDGARCAPTYYVDGTRWFAMGRPAIVELDHFLSSNELYGVEVYAGGASTPAQFDTGNGCGVVVFWTKQ